MQSFHVRKHFNRDWHTPADIMMVPKITTLIKKKMLSESSLNPSFSLCSLTIFARWQDGIQIYIG